MWELNRYLILNYEAFKQFVIKVIFVYLQNRYTLINRVVYIHCG